MLCYIDWLDFLVKCSMRKCKQCGVKFTPPQSRNGNNMRYCSKACRAKAYNEQKKEARRRYNKRNPRPRPPRIRLCEYCAKAFSSRDGKKYCSDTCREKARQDQNNSNQKRYRIKHPKSDKQKYYDNLGNSNLREHRHHFFDDETKLIRAERRRLHI